MKPYVSKCVFSDAQKHALKLATAYVTTINEGAFLREIRCHELARAVYQKLWPEQPRNEWPGQWPNASVIDGKFGAIEHSWIQIDGKAILDVYVPGSLPMVQLIHLTALLPSATSYKAGRKREDIRTGVVFQLLKQMEAYGAVPQVCTLEDLVR